LNENELNEVSKKKCFYLEKKKGGKKQLEKKTPCDSEGGGGLGEKEERTGILWCFTDPQLSKNRKNRLKNWVGDRGCNMGLFGKNQKRAVLWKKVMKGRRIGIFQRFQVLERERGGGPR